MRNKGIRSLTIYSKDVDLTGPVSVWPEMPHKILL
jgi:hypothetical protein